MKAEILQKLRQQSSGDASGTVPSADLPKDASDVDLSRQYLDDFEPRSVFRPRATSTENLMKFGC